jgi:hypothetical protein
MRAGSAAREAEGVGVTTGTRYVELFASTTSIQGTETTTDNGAYVETNPVHSRLIAPGPANGSHNRVTFEACV